MSYILKNFANGLLASAIGTGDLTLTVNNGHTLPTTVGDFIAVIWDPSFYSDPSKDPGTEILLCSYSGTTNLYNIIRAQESTLASTHPTGSVISLSITAGVLGNISSSTVATLGGSLLLTSGTGTLVNDNVSPGNSFYYGTDSGGNKGFFVLPSPSGSIPSGLICMWSGTIATIPSGWNLCDGTNSTPDLRDRFIVGATADDSGVAKTNVTGSLTASGDGSIPAHTHETNIQPVSGGSSAPSANSVGNGGSITTSSFGTGTKNIAVYYALAFIMKA